MYLVSWVRCLPGVPEPGGAIPGATSATHDSPLPSFQCDDCHHASWCQFGVSHQPLSPIHNPWFHDLPPMISNHPIQNHHSMNHPDHRAPWSPASRPLYFLSIGGGPSHLWIGRGASYRSEGFESDIVMHNWAHRVLGISLPFASSTDQNIGGHNVFSTKWMGLATGISTKWGEHRKQYKMTGHLPNQVILDE